jgi:hypothetical protein
MAAEVITLEGVVENGQIRIRGGVRLPERSLVYVVVPGLQTVPTVRIATPRLANPEQAVDFVMEVSEGPANAEL